MMHIESTDAVLLEIQWDPNKISKIQKDMMIDLFVMVPPIFCIKSGQGIFWAFYKPADAERTKQWFEENRIS